MTPAAIRGVFLKCFLTWQGHAISSSAHSSVLSRGSLAVTIRTVVSVRGASGSLNALSLISAEQRRAVRQHSAVQRCAIVR